jgi:hypothetical protein
VPPEVEAEEMSRAPIVPQEELMAQEPVKTEEAQEVVEETIDLAKIHVNTESKIAHARVRAEEPVAEEVKAEAEAVAEEKAEVAEVETQAAEETTVEVKAEETVVAETVETVEEVAAVETQEVAYDAIAKLTEGLEEQLAKSGLEVVHTRAELVKPISYAPVIYPGRPKKVLPPLDNTPLIQVHTKKAE